MLTACYDDSGTHAGAKAVVVCGLVASVDQWLRFERDWRDVLRMPQFDLEHLHMKELRSGKGRFAKFQDNLPLQRDLFDRLRRLVGVRVECTFAASILLDDFARVNADYRLEEAIGPPMVVAAEYAISRTLAWSANAHPDWPLRIVIDQGVKPHYGMLDDRIYERSGNRMVPASVAETPALQGADWAAWEIHRALTSSVHGKLKEYRDLRGSFRTLIDALGIDLDSDERIEMARWFLMDEAVIRDVSERIGIPKRG